MSKAKTEFVCQECGQRAAKWMGRCPGCNAWNTMVESKVEAEVKRQNVARTFRLPDQERSAPIALADVSASESARKKTGMGELDRVLGGGLVPGALILVGGDPGIGKSTLLLLALAHLEGRALYVTGEESPEQVKLRAARLGLGERELLLFAETRTDHILEAIEAASPSAVVVDSIQSIYDPSLESAPGSVAQIREVAARFLYLAKARGVPVLLVGHVTKDGALAGPRLLEHMVDTVLYFESSAGHPYRILRAHKNRFGSTNEIGVFEMEVGGLTEVANPSELFLAERPEDAPGSVVLPAIEGTRPVLVEVQALVSPTSFGTPRRTCLGFDSNRAALLVAVLERRADLQLLGCDVFVNVAGGMTIEEPAADLAVAIALASSLRNKPIAASTIVFGELGLAGELRAVIQAEARLGEAAKLGFTQAILPAANLKRIEVPSGIRVIPVKTIDEALKAGLD